MWSLPPGDSVLHFLSLVALAEQAMTAALAAGRRSMDWAGVCMLHTSTIELEQLDGGATQDSARIILAGRIDDRVAGLAFQSVGQPARHVLPQTVAENRDNEILRRSRGG